MFYEALAAAVAVVLLAISKDLARIVRLAIRPYFSPARIVPGPKPAHWFFGNMKEIIKAGPSEMHDLWHAQYGSVVNYNTMMNGHRLSIMDVRAISHVLSHSQEYQKPADVRRLLDDLLGEGLLVVEGETHRQQRRVMNPAFGTAQIRTLTDTFVDKALQGRDIWLQKLQSNQFEMKPGETRTGQIDVLQWLKRMTLDIIGVAGFGYDFKALEETSESGGELNHAMRSLLRPGGQGALDIIHNVLPVTRIVPSARNLEVREARATLERVGKRLLEERKAAVRAATVPNAEGKIERKDLQDKDILGLLVRANMASDLPESSRMTDDEVLAQIPTMLFAGHETTATAVTWIIFVLSKHPEIQDKLRAELVACQDGDRPSMDTLSNLRYLDAVVRETLRLYAPVASALREASKDDIIPTEKEWADKNGIVRSGIPVTKGDSIFIPNLSINRSKALWGNDALEFKPERWFDVPATASSIPGVWGNLLTFLGGNRACIGWRFSLFETKAIAYTLVRAFKFELAVSSDDIVMRTVGTVTPHLKDKIEAGPQLPVWVTAVADEAT